MASKAIEQRTQGITHGACLQSLEAMSPGCRQVHSGVVVACAGALSKEWLLLPLETQDCRRKAPYASSVRQRTNSQAARTVSMGKLMRWMCYERGWLKMEALGVCPGPAVNSLYYTETALMQMTFAQCKAPSLAGQRTEEGREVQAGIKKSAWVRSTAHSTSSRTSHCCCTPLPLPCQWQAEHFPRRHSGKEVSCHTML